MANSQIIVYFKSTPLVTPIFFKLASFFNILGINKTKLEKNRIIITTQEEKNEKMKNIRKLFKFFNILNIEKIETNY